LPQNADKKRANLTFALLNFKPLKSHLRKILCHGQIEAVDAFPFFAYDQKIYDLGVRGGKLGAVSPIKGVFAGCKSFTRSLIYGCAYNRKRFIQ
jgi:hypothetical protein